MKTLQNNFTTPEQSKRLLELGVPADSADGVYIIYNEGTDDEISQLTIPNDTQCKPCEMVEKGNENYKNGNVSFCLSWSVGRLIEIWEVVTGEKWLHETEQPIIEELISNFNYYSYDNDDPLDFSKLNK